MSTYTLSAEIRSKNEKLSRLRTSKKLPGIVYGKNQEPISLSLDSSEFLKLYRKAGESNIIELKAGKKELEVLVHATQKHVVTGEFTHVDFYAITRGEALTTKIALHFIGDAPAIKEGAIIEEQTKELEIKCRPKDLVDHFEVDLSKLVNPGDSIRVEDLEIDTDTFEILSTLEDVVASAVLPRAAVVDESEEVASEEESAEESSSEDTKEAE